MNGEAAGLFYLFGFFIVLVSICGLYCILVTRNLIRAIIGLEILIKGVTLLLVVAGYAAGQPALAQALVITVIVIEVVLIAVAGGIALRVFRHTDSLEVGELRKLKE